MPEEQRRGSRRKKMPSDPGLAVLSAKSDGSLEPGRKKRWPTLRVVDSAAYAAGGGRSEIRMAGREGVGGYRFAQKMGIKSKSVFSLAKRIAFDV
jgi:hypothetical protein